MILAITLLQLINVTLVIIFLFLTFKFLETNWSYKISKPHAWDAAVKNGEISKRLKKIERFYRDKVRFYTFWLQIQRLKQNGIPGSFAELGVYKGETARMIHLMDPSRTLHLFDTFEGFDKGDLSIETGANKEPPIDFSDTEVELVRKFVDGNDNILLYPGHFPGTSEKIPEQKFALVHLDADLYQPTLAGLNYFYPKLSDGGVIIIHDYNHTWDGVRKAVDEFIKGIPEKPSAIADWQGSLMLIKNKRE